MKSREEIGAKIKTLVLLMGNADLTKHAKIRGAIAALEWVNGYLEDLDSAL